MSDDDVIDVEPTEEEHLPAVREPASESTALVARQDITVSELVAQSNVIVEAMKVAMTEGVHYGHIPGVNKPTLLKPGAEKLLVLFRLSPEYDSEKIWHDDGHLTVSTKCALHHIPTGLKVAEGEGLCTTRESRYAYRTGGRTCPECSNDSIIKGKEEYGGGWLCFKKKGGCGVKWDDDTEQAKEFEEANLDRVPNPDLPDTYNTVLKMSDKRALLAAILNGTAASDVFTQDMEERGGSASGTPSESGGAAAPAERAIPDHGTLEFDEAILTSFLYADAPKTQAAVGERLATIDSDMEWGVWMDQCADAMYDSEGWRELEDEQKVGFFYLIANVIGKIEEGLTGDFPPLNREEIQSAFAWALDGEILPGPAQALSPDEAEAPLGKASESTEADQIGFGESSEAQLAQQEMDAERNQDVTRDIG